MALQTLVLCSDAIITSGGVSVGEANYTKTMMEKLGDVAFWKIAKRPARPMAEMVTFPAFVRPALLQIMGCAASVPPLLNAYGNSLSCST